MYPTTSPSKCKLKSVNPFAVASDLWSKHEGTSLKLKVQVQKSKVSILLGDEEVIRKDEYPSHQTFLCWDNALHFVSAVLDYKDARSEENQRLGVVGVLREDTLCHPDIKHNSNDTRKFANSVDYGSKIRGFSVRSERVFSPAKFA
jgi:hypothetical protein